MGPVPAPGQDLLTQGLLMLLIRAFALPPLPGQPQLVHIPLLRGKGMRPAEGTPAAARRTEFRLKEPRWR